MNHKPQENKTDALSAEAVIADDAYTGVPTELPSHESANDDHGCGAFDTADKAEITHFCKNCGSPCDSAYCGVCGQSIEVKRLQSRQFFVDLLSGLLRINRGFLFTAKHLVLHPWKVIRDYINGRRISYTHPVNMLVLLSFIGTVVSELFIPGSIADKASFEIRENSSLFYRIGVSIGDFFSNSTIAQNLTIYLPALLAIPLVYRKHGSNKYNVAEYFVAMIYMVCSFMIFQTLTTPLYLIFPDIDWNPVNMIYATCISGVSLYMAFTMPTRKARIMHFIYYLLSVFSIYLILAISLGIVLKWF